MKRACGNCRWWDHGGGVKTPGGHVAAACLYPRDSVLEELSRALLPDSVVQHFHWPRPDNPPPRSHMIKTDGRDCRTFEALARR